MCELRANLVGKQNRDPELFDRWADDAGRGRDHKLTMSDAALSNQQANPLLRWKAIALDVHGVSSAGNPTIVIEAGILLARTDAQDEPALVDVQDLDDLLGNVVNQGVRRRLPNSDDLGCSEHSVEVARAATGTGLLRATFNPPIRRLSGRAGVSPGRLALGWSQP